MSVYLFSKLFLLLMCSTSFAVAHYASGEDPGTATVQSVDFFKTDECFKALKLSGDGVEDNKKLDNVFFVTVGDFLVAVAEAQYTKTGTSEGSNTKVDFVAAYLKTTNDWDIEIFKQGGGDVCSKWDTQLATTNTNANSFSTLKNAAYDKRNNKIYLLAVNKTSASDSQWEYNLVIGTVSGSNNKALSIAWDETKKKITKISKEEDFKNKFTENFIGTSSIENSAFVMNDTKIVFVLRTTNKNDKNVIALLELKNSNSNQELNFLDVNETSKNCYPYFLPWGEKIVMIPSNCGSSDTVYQSVKESIDMKVWKDSPNLFYFLFDFLKDKTSFTTAVINDTNVLLFAKQKEQCSTTEEQGQKKCFTFWFSDAKRTYNIGQNVFYDDNKNVLSSSIIFVKNKLFFLHQKSDDDKKFILTRLDEQLEKITTTLDVWKKADQSVLKLCGPDSLNFEILCPISLPTNGLVGFLSNRNDGTNKWKDEYLYVNADMAQYTEIKNGLICNGEGQGATWPVGEGNEHQAYKFTKYGFTLLATVTIDKNTTDKANSLLGILFGEKENNFGLWCTTQNKFGVSKGTALTDIKPTKITCMPETKYQVAFILDKQLSVYINGEELTASELQAITIDNSHNIKHFYFGANTKKEQGTTTATDKSHVTIKNVLLYNWPFPKELIKVIKVPEKNTATNTKETVGAHNTSGQQSDDNIHDLERNTSETDKPSSTSATPTATEKDGAEIKSCSPLKNDFTVCSVLLLVGFTLLALYV